MTRNARPGATASALAVALTLVFAACDGNGASGAQGSSDGGSASPGVIDEEALQAFTQCMRDNGVANYPDPKDGFVFDNARDINADPTAFEAAWKACESLLPTPASGAGGNPAGNAGWEKVVPGGDCQCADGSQFAFWVRKADPAKVVFFLDGGGVCFDASSCAFTGTGGENDFYNWSITTENPGLGGGIWDFARGDNPFADYTIVYVPLCTGDSYLGNATHTYSPKLTVQHKGFVDGMAALRYLAEHYPDAAQVVVVGKTDGSVAAPLYGGLAADKLPDAEVTVFGAQSGAFPDDPDFNAEVLDELWGAYDTMPNWEVNQGLSARDWGSTRFWIQAGLHDPDIVMARFDYAFDPNAAKAVEEMGGDSSNLAALIDANEAKIEAAGVIQHSYTAPGEEHGIFEFERLYEIEVNGVRLVDWVESLLAGEPLDDVHCEECATS